MLRVDDQTVLVNGHQLVTLPAPTRGRAYAAGFLARIHALTTARPELRGVGFADLATEVTA